MQSTLKKEVKIKGIGLHSGAMVSLALAPAPVDHGIVFIRSDISEIDNIIPALWDRVVDTRLCTVIGNDAGVSVGTIEHLMAALRGCGIDNVKITLDGPEVPVMDGSSAPFIEMIDSAGITLQDTPRRVIKVLKEVTVHDGDKFVTLTPADGSVFSGEIEFEHPAIGLQKRDIRLLNGNFRHDLANSRTFGFLREVEAMRASGLARGGSLDNAIVLDDNKVLNPGGLRHGDEFIRHKLLDAVGDIYLAGGVIIGAYDSYKGGHALNNGVLRKLFATPGAWAAVRSDVAEEMMTAPLHTRKTYATPATVSV